MHNNAHKPGMLYEPSIANGKKRALDLSRENVILERAFKDTPHTAPYNRPEEQPHSSVEYITGRINRLGIFEQYEKDPDSPLTAEWSWF